MTVLGLVFEFVGVEVETVFWVGVGDEVGLAFAAGLVFELVSGSGSGGGFFLTTTVAAGVGGGGGVGGGVRVRVRVLNPM